MKYSSELYANAFLGALEESKGRKGEETIVKNFANLLERSGDLQNYEKISLEIEKLMAKRGGGNFVAVEVAGSKGLAAQKLSVLFSKKDAVRVNILPELLAGARVLINGERELDFSFKRRLKDLFGK